MKMNFLKKLFARLTENSRTAKGNLTLELTEINDIAEKLVNRIDNKIKILKTVEAQADQKIAILDRLITKFKNISPSDGVGEEAEKGHLAEVRSLADKGFNAEQIARILDLPSGEVELILNLAQ